MAKLVIPRITMEMGDRGPDVERLHRYLIAFGYFPNDELAQRYSHWRPLIAHMPANMEMFDDTTQTALRMFQRVHGMPESGRLDQATLDLMKKPRCGFPDALPEAKSGALGQAGSFVAQGNKWTKQDLSYQYSNYSSDLTREQARAAITRSFHRWAVVAPLTFTETATGADIRIGWFKGAHRDGQDFDGPGMVLAHGFYPPPNGGAIAGDLHFDDAETWSVDTPPTGTDLATVSLHELGHVLGLDHSSSRSAAMYAYYSGAKRELTEDDAAGIRSLYGTRTRKIFEAESATKTIPADRKIVALRVTIRTGDIDNAGTDADVYFEVAGKSKLLDKPNYDDFERGDVDGYVWQVQGTTMGDLRTHRIRLHHNNIDERPGWYVAKLTLQVQLDNSSVFSTYKTWDTIGWLAKDEPLYFLTEALLQDAAER